MVVVLWGMTIIASLIRDAFSIATAFPWWTDVGTDGGGVNTFHRVTLGLYIVGLATTGWIAGREVEPASNRWAHGFLAGTSTGVVAAIVVLLIEATDDGGFLPEAALLALALLGSGWIVTPLAAVARRPSR